MSMRLDGFGRLIDRSQPMNFSFNGKRLRGFAGDTLASALLGADQMMVARGFKYHRPRGAVSSGAEEPNAVVGIGTDGRFEPDQRATTTELFEGLDAKSQNHWPSLEWDIGAVNGLFARFLPAGFYYKTFMAPPFAWKHVFEPFIRQSAGLGAAPHARDVDSYEHLYAHYDVVVVGGGVAGLAAAQSAAATGASVLVMEQTAQWGGRGPVDGGEIDGFEAGAWVQAAVAALDKAANVTLRLRMQGSGVYDHGYLLGYERVADHTPGDDRPRHRLWRIRAGRIITATGALERPLAFCGNDVPGVMLASAARDYLVNWGVAVGRRIVVVTNNDDAYRTALAYQAAGLTVEAVLDARAQVNSPLARSAREAGITVLEGRGIGAVKGRDRVKGVLAVQQSGDGGAGVEIACDGVAMSGGWSPVVHLWSHCGGKLVWDDAKAMFCPDLTRAPSGADGGAFVLVAGAAAGAITLAEGLAQAHAAGKVAGREMGGKAHRKPAPKAAVHDEQPIEPVWVMPAQAGPAKRAKMWLDYQNDVKVSDVQLAAREGYGSVEHTKRYTTLGMATDQGKISNINGLAVLSQALNQEIPETGTTTFRPPYTPVSFGAIAGAAAGDLFQPIRKTPMHGWHEAHGAHWEPVGQWRRPYTYLRGGESPEHAVAREVVNTRENVGLLDASTLGKIIVKGPDAGKFLDMMYTNMMSSLPVGKCRYGLMCTENGFLTDDGVVARLDDETWLCHTTTGGADRIHGHMEEWLQTEWWEWQVFTANVTEEYAQIAVVGPKARKVLEALGGMDVSKAALPFMQWAEGMLGGLPVRIFRISFSGELSYEVSVPASMGQALWDKLLEAGEPHGMMPYGTEGLHVLRAEKGFIMIGDETDGTVIPQDLGLGWALSKKKDDYLGKRAQQRRFMTDPERWKLVGLETLDGGVIPDGAYVVDAGRNANGQRNTQGRVTSSYHSPTLKRGIAMALVRHGPDRMGEVVQIPTIGGPSISAKIVDPVFYDKEGAKQNV